VSTPCKLQNVFERDEDWFVWWKFFGEIFVGRFGDTELISLGFLFSFVDLSHPENQRK